MLDKRRLFILIAVLVGSIAVAFALQAWLVSGPGDVAASPLVKAQQLLAYRQGGDVWLVSAADQSRWRMTDNGDARDPAVSPDGTRLAYVVVDQGRSGAIAQLWVANLAEGKRRLAAEGEMPWAAPVWSPDGQRLAWAAGSWVVTVPADGRPQTLLRDAQLGVAGRPQLAWSADGKTVLAILIRGEERGLYALPLRGHATLLQALDIAGPALVATSPVTEQLVLWYEGTLALFADASGKGEATPLATDMLPPDVTQIGFWGDGGGILLATAYSGLWSSRLDEWQLVPTEADELASAPVGALALGPQRMALRQALGPNDESLALVSPDTGALQWLVPPVVAEAAAMPVCRDCAGTSAQARADDWYRYQGAAESGPVAHSNCGPTSVAMATQFATGQIVPIADIRAYIGGGSWTSVNDLMRALKHYGVAHQRLSSVAAVEAAIRDRGSVVLAHLWMHWITPGRDLQAPFSPPELNAGRYYAYDQSRWVVLRGFAADASAFVAYDPNVWDGNGVYWYANKAPKGKDRLYPYAQVAGSMAAYGFEVIEVFADEAVAPEPQPTLEPTPAAERTGEGFWYRVQPGDMLYLLAQEHDVAVAAIAAANDLGVGNLIYIGQRLWIPQGGAMRPEPTPTKEPVMPTPTTATLPTLEPSSTAAPETPTEPTTTPPEPTATAPSPEEGQWHVVMAGETMAVIAGQYGLSVDELLAANPDVNPLLLQVGQRIWVPVPATPEPPTLEPGPDEFDNEQAEPEVALTPTPAGEGLLHVVLPGDTLWNLSLHYGATVEEIAAANGIDAGAPLKVGQTLIIPR